MYPRPDGLAGHHRRAIAGRSTAINIAAGHPNWCFAACAFPRQHAAGEGPASRSRRNGWGRAHSIIACVSSPSAERAIERLARAKARVAFGAPALRNSGAVRQAIGQRVAISAVRGWSRCRRRGRWTGPPTARRRRATPSHRQIVRARNGGRILDRAIQIHGGSRMSQDFFLAALRGDAVPAHRRRPGRGASRGFGKAEIAKVV